MRRMDTKRESHKTEKRTKKSEYIMGKKAHSLPRMMRNLSVLFVLTTIPPSCAFFPTYLHFFSFFFVLFCTTFSVFRGTQLVPVCCVRDTQMSNKTTEKKKKKSSPEKKKKRRKSLFVILEKKKNFPNEFFTDL